MGRRCDEDFRREIESHLTLETDRQIAEGAAPHEARDRALRKFGSPLRAQERHYESRRMMWLHDFIQDVQYAWRAFARQRSFTAAAILTVALGVGANTALFSVINAVLLRPLPFPDSERLVRIVDTSVPSDSPVTPGIRSPRISVAELAVLRDQSTTLTHIGMYLSTGGTLTWRNQSRRVVGARVTVAMFDALGVAPLMGRAFDARDDGPSGAVVILSHALWQRDFGGDPNVIGASAQLDTRQLTIVGVMPPGFYFPDHFVEFWTPYLLPGGRGATMQRTSPIARLAPGVDLLAAAEEVTAIVSRMRGSATAGTPTAPRVEVIPLKDQLVAPVRPALLVLTAAVALVLLIACVNVANLLFSRSVAREREIAMRRALGAGTGRLLRQMLTESVLLAGCGGVAAVAVAIGAVRVLQAFGSGLPRRDLSSVVTIPRLDEISIDLSVLVFALLASLITGLLFGLAPALRLARLQPLEALRTAASPIHSGFSLLRRQRTQGLLIVVEIAIAVMLCTQGGLLIRSFVNLTGVDAGYSRDDVLTFQVAMPGGRAASARVTAVADRLVDRLREVPGVVAAAYSEHVPMVQSRSGTPLRRTPEAPPPSAGRLQGADVHAVSRDFVSVMGMRVIAGRAFDDRDGAGQPQVMLINEALARTGLFDRDPVGQLIYAFGPVSKAPWQVIGVVADVRQYGLDQPAVPQIFIDMRQSVLPGGPPLAVPEYFAVRTEGSMAALVPRVRRILADLDPEATLESVATMNELVANSVTRPRLYAVLVAIFAAIAVALAVIGIYGVLSYLVVHRVREIGVRMALGADRWRVMRLVIGDVIVVALAGTAVGLGGAAAMTRSLRQLLFGLSPFDPATFAATAALLIAVAVLSAYLPAYRATKIDPLVALRCQ